MHVSRARYCSWQAALLQRLAQRQSAARSMFAGQRGVIVKPILQSSQAHAQQLGLSSPLLYF